MLKPLLITATLLGSLVAHANTVEIATDLYSKRGEDVNNAKQAAKIFKTLAAAETDKLAKGKLMISGSEANYFVGTKQTEKDSIRKYHEAGYDVALAAVRLLREVPGQEALTERSRALYFYGSNLGKWGETKFILSVLKLWKKKLRPRMMTLATLDDSVEDFGVYRILGRAFVKVPGEDKGQALKYLETAFENTKIKTDDFTVASNSTTTRYLLWAYTELNEDFDVEDKFCDLYDSYETFVESDREVQDKVNLKLIPETQEEVKMFKQAKDKEIKSIKSYYQETCE